MADAPQSSGPALAPGLHFDPETVPPDPAFADVLARGPAVPLDRLEVPALRARFAAPPPWQPEMRADGRVLDPERVARAAAVLLPLVARPSGVHVLLTQRTAHLHDHAGQISFPGGRADEGDADPVATALREAQEEIGLDPGRVEIIGRLPEYVTVTSYRVTPVIGLDRTAARSGGAAARRLRGRRGLRGAAGVPHGSAQPRAASRGHGRAVVARSTPCPTRARAVISSGARPRRCCAISTS